MSALETIEQEPVAPLAPPAAPPQRPAPVGRINLSTMGFEEMQRVARVLLECGYYGEMSSIAQVVAKLIVGQELGLTIYEAMTGVRFILGKLELAPALMAARINRSTRYSYKIERNDNDSEPGVSDPACVIAYYDGGELLGRSSFSMNDGVRAGLSSGANWKKYGRNMRFARAMSNGAKMFCGDICGGGAVYVEGEIEGGADMLPATVTAITHLATPPPPVALVDTLQASVLAKKAERAQALAKDLGIPVARHEANLEKFDGDLDAVIADYEAKKSQAVPVRGPAPVVADPIAEPVAPPEPVAETPVAPPVAVEKPVRHRRAEPLSAVEKAVLEFKNSDFADDTMRHSFAATVLGWESVESFKDLTESDLGRVVAALKARKIETAEFERQAALERDATKEQTSGEIPNPNGCNACGVLPGVPCFSGCENA